MLPNAVLCGHVSWPRVISSVGLGFEFSLKTLLWHWETVGVVSYRPCGS